MRLRLRARYYAIMVAVYVAVVVVIGSHLAAMWLTVITCWVIRKDHRGAWK